MAAKLKLAVLALAFLSLAGPAQGQKSDDAKSSDSTQSNKAEEEKSSLADPGSDTSQSGRPETNVIPPAATTEVAVPETPPAVTTPAVTTPEAKAPKLLSQEQVVIRNKAIMLNRNGMDLLKNNKFKEAAAKFTEALRVDPAYDCTYVNRAITYVQMQSDDLAIKDCNAAIATGDEDVKAAAYLNRGMAYRNKADYPEAMKNYTQALEIKPKYAFAFCNRSLVHYILGDKENALKDVEACLAIDPTNPQALSNRRVFLKGAPIGGFHTAVRFSELKNRPQTAGAKPQAKAATKPASVKPAAAKPKSPAHK